MKELIISYQNLPLDQLSDSEKELVKQAQQSMEKAHAPYSNFTVGSAVKMTNGSIFGGSNQENAAYPSGLCAERVALFKAKSESKEPIECIVILAKNEKGAAADAFACGGCRQVIIEYANLQADPIKVLMRDKSGNFVSLKDARALLPFSFEAKTLD